MIKFLNLLAYWRYKFLKPRWKSTTWRKSRNIIPTFFASSLSTLASAKSITSISNKLAQEITAVVNPTEYLTKTHRHTGWTLWFCMCRTPWFSILVHTSFLIKGLLLQNVLFAVFHQAIHAYPFIPTSWQDIRVSASIWLLKYCTFRD